MHQHAFVLPSQCVSYEGFEPFDFSMRSTQSPRPCQTNTKAWLYTAVISMAEQKLKIKTMSYILCMYPPIDQSPKPFTKRLPLLFMYRTLKGYLMAPILFSISPCYETILLAVDQFYLPSFLVSMGVRQYATILSQEGSTNLDMAYCRNHVSNLRITQEVGSIPTVGTDGQVA